MFLYAALDAPWVKATDAHSLGLLLAGFVAPLEIVATVFAFLARDTVAGATLGLFDRSWFVAGLTTMQAKPGQLDASVGYFLIAFCVAMYGGIAFLLEDMLGRTVLPLGRRGGSRRAMEGDLDEQLQGLADEAGVRHTL